MSTVRSGTRPTRTSRPLRHRVEDACLAPKRGLGREARRPVALDRAHLVPATERIGRLGRQRRSKRADPVVAEHLVGGLLDAGAELICARPGDKRGEHLGDVGAPPGGARLFEAGDREVYDRLPVFGGRCQRLAEHPRQPALRCLAPGRGLLAPAGDEDFGRGLGLELRGPAAIGGELETARPLTTRELATELGLAARDELCAKGLHFVATRRPGLDEHLGHAFDLGDAVLVDRRPSDPERGGELGPKRRVVQHAGGLLVLVELATIEAEPPAVLGAHLVGEKDMGMKLRVRGARGAVEEARGDEALGVDLEDPACAASGEGGVVLQEGERARKSAFVRGDDGCAELFAAGSPQHRDALRWREGQPEAGDDVVVVGRERPPEPMCRRGDRCRGR